MTITHNGKEYEVDIERAISSNLATPSKDNARAVHNGEEYHVDIQNAIKLGIAKPIIPFVVGGVYRDKAGNVNSLILVQAIYFYGEIPPDKKLFCLLGIGLGPNSNGFYESLHSKEEILNFLEKRGMEFSHGINEEVSKLKNIKKA